MKIPNYVQMALRKREKAKRSFYEADCILTEFIKKYGFENEIDPADYRGSFDSFLFVNESNERIKQAIQKR